MSDFKFGHRVLVRTNDNSKSYQKARFIEYSGHPRPYLVLLDGVNYTQYVNECKLDPEATEFVIGDEVEVRDYDHEIWIKGIYAGYVKGHLFPHFAKRNNLRVKGNFNHCRYIQPEEAEQPEAQIIELNGKKYQITEVQE